MHWCPNLGADGLLVLNGNYLSAPSRSVGSFLSFRWAAFTHVQRLHSTSQFTEDMVTVICGGHMIPIRNTHQSVPVGSQEVERSVCCRQEQRFVSFGVKNKVFFHNKLSRLQIWIKPRRKSTLFSAFGAYSFPPETLQSAFHLLVWLTYLRPNTLHRWAVSSLATGLPPYDYIVPDIHARMRPTEL